MANNSTDPSSKNGVGADTDQLTREDLEKVAAGGVTFCDLNVSSFAGKKTAHGGGTVGPTGVAGTMTRKMPGS